MNTKILLSCIFLLLWNCLFSQEKAFPKIPTAGNNISDFIPKGWKILSSAKGDLNKDNLADAAIVIEKPRAKNERNPQRILFIIFRSNNNQTYQLASQSNTFIINQSENPSMDEPFDKVEIKNGTLLIKFNYWFSAGSSYTTNQTFVFRFQNKTFALIGYASDSQDRFSLGSFDKSFNFLTNRYETFVSRSEDDKGTKTSGKLKPSPLLTFKDINPYNFSVDY